MNSQREIDGYVNLVDHVNALDGVILWDPVNVIDQLNRSDPVNVIASHSRGPVLTPGMR